MNAKSIRQSIIFKAAPHEVFDALMDSRKHSKFTGARASISRKAGGKFNACHSSLSGITVELIANKRIVQAWRCEMEGWPKDHYSRAIFSLKKVRGGTGLVFTQSGVPEECYDSISEGWRDYY